MTSPEPTEPLSAELSVALVDFARTCKAAARSVSLYPATHPAIQGALARVVQASQRLTSAGNATITVLPDSLVIDGRTPAKPDSALAEFAALLHDRLIGELRVDQAADAADWRTLLLLLSRTTEDLMAEGGIAKLVAATAQPRFTIREIDYAEVLREREGADAATWDRIVAYCLQFDGDRTLDERTLDAVIATLGDDERVRELIGRIQTDAKDGNDLAARTAALLGLVRQAVEMLRGRRQDDDGILQALARTAAHMTPEMMLAILRARQHGEEHDRALASAIVERMGNPSVAAFVAGAVVAEGGATDRLALAFEALSPEAERKAELLSLARSNVERTALGKAPEFEDLWRRSTDLLTSYSDKSFVSEEYGRELSGTRTRALEIESLADDPRERIEAWVATVSEHAVRQLDLELLLDLLRIEAEPAPWQAIASTACGDIERRMGRGEVSAAHTLLDALVAERAEGGRANLQDAANDVLAALASGPFIHHLVSLLQRVDDGDVEALSRICHAIGPAVVRPLAFALAVEENGRAIRRLRELLLGFGAAGRQSVEPLKHSPNPAVRRTAIDLLRVFGGREALPELASMLDDADPQVKRESIRAIVQIGTEDAYAVLEQALVGGGASRDTILQQLPGLREDKAAPLLCYVLNHSAPRGKLLPVHLQIIETVGSLAPLPESVRTLRAILYGGEWWAPFRTAALRQAAAAALRRLGSPDARAVLQQAADNGSRGVRHAARQYAPTASGGA